MNTAIFTAWLSDYVVCVQTRFGVQTVRFNVPGKPKLQYPIHRPQSSAKLTQFVHLLLSNHSVSREHWRAQSDQHPTTVRSCLFLAIVGACAIDFVPGSDPSLHAVRQLCEVGVDVGQLGLDLQQKSISLPTSLPAKATEPLRGSVSDCLTLCAVRLCGSWLLYVHHTRRQPRVSNMSPPAPPYTQGRNFRGKQNVVDLVSQLQIALLYGGGLLGECDLLEKGDDLLLPEDAFVLFLQVDKGVGGFAVPDVGQPSLNAQPQVVADDLSQTCLSTWADTKMAQNVILLMTITKLQTIAVPFTAHRNLSACRHVCRLDE